MSTPTIFEVCRPRADVLAGKVAEADFAADLAQVVKGEASAEYADPARFFANTYPTEGLRRLLANVCRRLSGTGGEAAAIFRLDTSYGGGNADPANGRAMGEGVLAHTPWGEIAFALAGAEGIDNMGCEEAAYWLGMAMHRKNPRRVLTALRVLLTTPRARATTR